MVGARIVPTNRFRRVLVAATVSVGLACTLGMATLTPSTAHAATTTNTSNAKVTNVACAHAKVSWNKATASKVKGYQVKIYKNGTRVKSYAVKSRNSTAKTVTGLHANTSYTATVRSYMKSGKKTTYGATNKAYFTTSKMTGQMLANQALAEYKSGRASGTYHKGGMKYKRATGHGAKTTWCSIFVSYNLAQLGHSEFNSAWVKDFSGKYADRYPNLMTRHKNTGYTPQVGDLAIWRPKGQAWDVLGGSRSHIGIVYKVDTKNKMVYTVEGNAHPKRGSKVGDRVFLRAYHYGKKDSYTPDLFITVCDK